MPEKKPIVIANWKMKLDNAASVALALTLKKRAASNAEIVICPSFTAITEVAKAIQHSGIALGAQDCFWEAQGSYTGEISPSFLKSQGCDFVIVGHSERRQYLEETDDMVHRKVDAALSAGLTPVICVGETFDQRQEGSKDYTLIQQTTKALEGLQVSSGQRIVIAYEPVWVIGSGHAIEPEEAALSQQIIRQTLLDLFDPEVVKNNFLVIYGGSVDRDNVHKFVGLEDNNGFLVGVASLVADDFLEIVNNV